MTGDEQVCVTVVGGCRRSVRSIGSVSQPEASYLLRSLYSGLCMLMCVV